MTDLRGPLHLDGRSFPALPVWWPIEGRLRTGWVHLMAGPAEGSARGPTLARGSVDNGREAGEAGGNFEM